MQQQLSLISSLPNSPTDETKLLDSNTKERSFKNIIDSQSRCDKCVHSPTVEDQRHDDAKELEQSIKEACAERDCSDVRQSQINESVDSPNGADGNCKCFGTGDVKKSSESISSAVQYSQTPYYEVTRSLRRYNARKHSTEMQKPSNEASFDKQISEPGIALQQYYDRQISKSSDTSERDTSADRLKVGNTYFS